MEKHTGSIGKALGKHRESIGKALATHRESIGVKGGTNVAPELAEVGPVEGKGKGFAVGAAARGPSGGAIVLPDGSRELENHP